MAEAPDGKNLATRLREGRINVPAEAPQTLSLDRRIARSEQRSSWIRFRSNGFPGGFVGCSNLAFYMSALHGSRHQLQSCLLQRKLARNPRKLIKQRLRIDN